VACAFSARHFDRWCRTSFLESRLITELVELDPLTGAKNRRVFDEHLASLWQQGIKDRRPLAILLIDVDHFKAFNDRYGHQAGDHALRRVAQALKAHVHRPLDVLTRYGGEEFAALIYDVNASQAEQVAEQMRRAVTELGIEHRASRTGATVSVSVGVAAIEPGISRKPRGATQLADEALYEAKLRGRNSVVVLDDNQYKLLVTGVFSNQHLARGVEQYTPPPPAVSQSATPAALRCMTNRCPYSRGHHAAKAPRLAYCCQARFVSARRASATLPESPPQPRERHTLCAESHRRLAHHRAANRRGRGTRYQGSPRERPFTRHRRRAARDGRPAVPRR
jgi:diguanylate cyclase (GGDEF)-like protein